jgi:bacterioferritin-associated ferredoxin
MIVCVCHRVSDRDIESAAREGVPCFEALQQQTRVSSSCGRCESCARETFDSACRRAGSMPVAQLVPA